MLDKDTHLQICLVHYFATDPRLEVAKTPSQFISSLFTLYVNDSTANLLQWKGNNRGKDNRLAPLLTLNAIMGGKSKIKPLDRVCGIITFFLHIVTLKISWEARFPQKDVISIQKIVHYIKKARTIGGVRHRAVLSASGPTTAGTVND